MNEPLAAWRGALGRKRLASFGVRGAQNMICTSITGPW
jgi:hypothetical protein